MSESVGTFRWNSSTPLLPIPGNKFNYSFQTGVLGVTLGFRRRLAGHFDLKVFGTSRSEHNESQSGTTLSRRNVLCHDSHFHTL
jgi:hypothetical protein